MRDLLMYGLNHFNVNFLTPLFWTQTSSHFVLLLYLIFYGARFEFYFLVVAFRIFGYLLFVWTYYYCLLLVCI